MRVCEMEGHKPDIWRTEGDLQVKRCQECNKIVVTAKIPQPRNPKEDS